MCRNHPGIVKTLLTIPDLRLDTADECGRTALHWACFTDENSSIIIPLLALHRGCTSAVLNKRAMYGFTPLMIAVDSYSLECVKELGKFEGTNFRAKNERGETLLDVARMSPYYENDNDEMIKYLLEKQKEETLAEKAAYHVASHINNVQDAERLGIPRTLCSLVNKFFD